jgi:hypothetical protein
MFTVGPDDVAEGDRIFASHGEWMKGHPREGDVALLDYSISKAPELSNPLDPSSEPTGKTIFVIDEYYESPAGIARHWQQTSSWPEFPVAVEWMAKATIVTLHNGAVAHRPRYRGVPAPPPPGCRGGGYPRSASGAHMDGASSGPGGQAPRHNRQGSALIASALLIPC